MNYLFLETASPANNNAMQEIFAFIVNDKSGHAMRITITAIVIVSVLIVLLILYLGKLFNGIINNNELLKIGPLTIKSKKPLLNKVNTDKKIMVENSKTIDANSFMNILDIIMSVELEKIITDSINATKDIHNIETEYDKQAESIFSKTFITVQNEYHNEFVSLACEKTGFDINKIKNTREYFFIIDLLREYKDIWMHQSKEITRRNGFVEFLDDHSKSKTYIDELNDSVYQCIDIRKLESTDLTKNDLEKAIRKVVDNINGILERMFLTLATIKKQMLKKRKDKLEYINNIIKDSVIKILKDVNEKILKSSDNEIINDIVTNDDKQNKNPKK